VCRVHDAAFGKKQDKISVLRRLKIVSDEQGGGLVAEAIEGSRDSFRSSRSKPVVGSSRMMMGGLADGGARNRDALALTADKVAPRSPRTVSYCCGNA